MDSEVRHELDKNELAHLLAKGGTKFRPLIPVLLTGILLLIVAGVAYVYLAAASREKLHDAWNTLAETNTPDGYEQVATEHGNSLVGGYADLQLGWIRYNQGKGQVVADRGESIRLLDDAVESFDKAIKSPGAHNALKAIATLGVGLSHEAKSKLEEAKKDYQSIVDRYPKDSVAQIASYRLTVLAKPETETFYQALKNYQPPITSGDLPAKIEPGAAPVVVPDVPQSLDSSAPAVPAPPTDAPAETPAPTAPQDAKPAETPAPATPEPAKPEEPKPATPEPSSPEPAKPEGPTAETPKPSEPAPPATPAPTAPEPTPPAAPTTPEPAPATPEPAPATPPTPPAEPAKP